MQQKKKHALTAAFVLVAAQMLWFVHSYATPLFYYDAWDIYFQLWDDQRSLWELFLAPVGTPPHRAGLGNIFAKLYLNASGWNPRVESFSIAAMFIASTGIAILIKRRLEVAWSYWDLLLISQLLTIASWETLVGTPVAAIGAVPMLWIFLTALSLLIPQPMLRCGVLALGCSVAIFCAYGYVTVPAASALLTFTAWREKDRSAKLFAGGSLFFLLIVFAYYATSAGTGAGQDSHRSILAFFQFVGALSVYLFGWHMYFWPLPYVGILIFLVLLFTVFLTARTLVWKRDAASEVIFFLLSATLTFVLLASWGRSEIGVRAAYTSRYLAYLLPGYFAVYLAVQTLAIGSMRRALLRFLLVGQLVMHVVFYLHQYPKVRHHLLPRQEIVECLKRGDALEVCQRQANYSIHPDGAQLIQPKLDLLKARGLGPWAH
jgi:hypothetical protein